MNECRICEHHRSVRCLDEPFKLNRRLRMGRLVSIFVHARVQYRSQMYFVFLTKTNQFDFDSCVPKLTDRPTPKVSQLSTHTHTLEWPYVSPYWCPHKSSVPQYVWHSSVFSFFFFFFNVKSLLLQTSRDQNRMRNERAPLSQTLNCLDRQRFFYLNLNVWSMKQFVNWFGLSIFVHQSILYSNWRWK